MEDCRIEEVWIAIGWGGGRLLDVNRSHLKVLRQCKVENDIPYGSLFTLTTMFTFLLLHRTYHSRRDNTYNLSKYPKLRSSGEIVHLLCDCTAKLEHP